MDDQSPRTTTPRRRRWRVAAVLAAAAVVAGTSTAAIAALTPSAAASATQSPAATSRHVTVLRFAVTFSPFHIVDVPPLAKQAGDYGVGDYVVFSDQLLDGRGRVVGTEGGSGLLTGILPSIPGVSTGGPQVAYDLTIGLRQGQIAVQGLASPAANKQLGIVGGTGRYVGASGHIDLTEFGNGKGSLVVTLGA
jgi:hypothetical protein